MCFKSGVQIYKKSSIKSHDFTNLVTGFPEASFPVLILFQDREKMLFGKIGPHHWQEEEFGISQLPQKEVADTALPTRADQHIGVGN